MRQAKRSPLAMLGAMAAISATMTAAGAGFDPLYRLMDEPAPRRKRSADAIADRSRIDAAEAKRARKAAKLMRETA